MTIRGESKITAMHYSRIQCRTATTAASKIPKSWTLKALKIMTGLIGVFFTVSTLCVLTPLFIWCWYYLAQKWEAECKIPQRPRFQRKSSYFAPKTPERVVKSFRRWTNMLRQVPMSIISPCWYACCCCKPTCQARASIAAPLQLTNHSAMTG